MNISVVIPCFNSQGTLKYTLDSLNKQTVSGFEIIVVDDGSFEEVVVPDNVKLIRHKQNLGIAASRNTGFKNSSREIVVFVDADVQLAEDFIENILNAYNSDVAGVGGRLDETKKGSLGKWRSLYLRQHFGDKSINDIPMLFGALSSYRKKVLQDLGGFDEFFKTNAEDVDFGIRLKKAGYILGYTPYALGKHLRVDNFLGIIKNIFRWYYWGYKARQKNLLIDRNSANKEIKQIILQCKNNIYEDLFVHKNMFFPLMTMINCFMKIITLILVVG